MIPAITALKGSLSTAEQLVNVLPPLTIRSLLRDTYLDTGQEVNIRRKGELSWIENQNVASLTGRIEFINQLISYVIENIPQRNTPLTLVSMGSGGLLTEKFINQQLKKAGYSDIHWRMIDVDYQQNGYRPSRNEFRDKVEKNVLSFTSEQAYLNKNSGPTTLAVDDKFRGASIILSIDPPSPLEGQEAATCDVSDCMLIRGRPVNDIKQANAIYLLVADKSRQDKLIQVHQHLTAGDHVVMMEGVLKCTLNSQSDCEVTFCPSSSGQALNRDVKPFLEYVHRVADQTGQKLKLKHIDKALGKYISSLENAGLAGIKFYVSDYDTSVTRLRQHFQNGNNPALFAAFENNQVRFQP